MKLYFDVCCLNRPFDDQSQPRIRMEAEAVLSVMERADLFRWTICGSDVIEHEIGEIPEEERRLKVAELSRAVTETIAVDGRIERRAEGLARRGFTALDALHLACAERENVDIFLSTDDNLIRRAASMAPPLKVRVANPAAWWIEQQSP